MTDRTIIRFCAGGLAQRGRMAGSLADALKRIAPDLPVERLREDAETMDFGASLALILSGPAILAVARGIEVWLQKHHGVELDITTPDGRHVLVKNMTSADIAVVLSASGKQASD